jgi:hypothetical protein
VLGLEQTSREELIVLWVLLLYARDIEIQQLQVVGDSKVVLEWFQRKALLEILVLIPWQCKD